MKKHTGSAFVGMIVCIAIAVIGAGVMLPTLLKSRQQSQAIMCMNNLKQIGIASFNYAADFHGYLPPWPEAGHSPLREGVRSFITGNYYRAEDLPNYAPPVNPAIAAGGAVPPGANIVQLTLQGYLGRWQRGTSIQNIADAVADPNFMAIRFCPGLQDRWPDIAKKFGGSYFYNPHWIAVDPSYWADKVAQFPAAANLKPIDPPVTVWYRRLADYPPNAALGGDMIASRNFIAHPSGAASARWNLLFPDGHVASAADGYVPARLNSPAPTPMDELRSLEDNLDILETEAAGRNPMREALLPPRAVDVNSPLTNREVEAKRDKTVNYY